MAWSNLCFVEKLKLLVRLIDLVGQNEALERILSWGFSPQFKVVLVFSSRILCFQNHETYLWFCFVSLIFVWQMQL